MKTFSEKEILSMSFLLGAVLALAGIIYTYINLSDAYQFYSDARRFKETTAVISDIVYLGRRNRTVYVQYEIDGVRYDNTLGRTGSNSKMRRGDIIKIYYNPQAPGRIYGEEHGRSCLSFTMLSIISTCAGIWFIRLGA